MNTIILFDPSIRSLNLGDHIIMQSSEKELNTILRDNLVIHSATHAPAVTCYQNYGSNMRLNFFDKANYKFICGSNLLWKNMLKLRPSLNVNLWNCRPYLNSILLGVGTNAGEKTNIYTKTLYKKILTNQYAHSVRDSATEQFVESLGFKAINTGCPTMWNFTNEFCSEIPTQKTSRVVFTLTDYKCAPEYDQQLIDILNRNYEHIYFWIQGAFDFKYLKSLNRTENFTIIPPTLEAYEELLLADNIEYVGTRLHAGMFAKKNKKRTIILSVDNRVEDLKRSYSINTVSRNDIDGIENMICSQIKTRIGINEENIAQWLSQFI